MTIHCLQNPAAPSCSFMPSSQSPQSWLFIEKQPDDVPQELELPPPPPRIPDCRLCTGHAPCPDVLLRLNCKLLSLTCDFKGPAVSRSLHPCLGEVREPKCASRRGPAGLVQHVLGSWVPAPGQGCAGELSACSPRPPASSLLGSTFQLEKVHQLAH